MTKKIVAISLAVLLCVAVGAFAKETKPSKTYPWMASYNQPGQLNLYASVGWYGYGIELSAGPEFIIGSFDIADIPLEWGITVRGLVGFGGFLGYASWIDWGVAPMAALHWGVDLGGALKFDWYVGLGLAISGSTGTYYSWGSSGGLNFGPASFNGVTWQFSDNIGLIAEYAYAGYVSVGGVGVKFNL
jgi:hypothetical protein